MTTTSQTPEQHAHHLMHDTTHNLHADFENESGTFIIGYADYPDRAALVWIIEAARHLCGMNHEATTHLLRMALDDLEART